MCECAAVAHVLHVAVEACAVSAPCAYRYGALFEAGFTELEKGKIGRMEGGTLYRLNCDLCDSRICRIGEQRVAGWKIGRVEV